MLKRFLTLIIISLLSINVYSFDIPILDSKEPVLGPIWFLYNNEEIFKNKYGVIDYINIFFSPINKRVSIGFNPFAQFPCHSPIDDKTRNWVTLSVTFNF